VVRIHLTAKGKQMRDVSRNTVIKFNEAVQSRFTQAQLSNFRQVMSELDRIARTRTTLLNMNFAATTRKARQGNFNRSTLRSLPPCASSSAVKRIQPK
jgi:hypothetical protein